MIQVPLSNSSDDARRPENLGVDVQNTKPTNLILNTNTLPNDSRNNNESPNLAISQDQRETSGSNLTAGKAGLLSRVANAFDRPQNGDGINTPAGESSPSLLCEAGEGFVPSIAPPPIKYTLSYKWNGQRIREQTVDNIQLLEPTFHHHQTQHECVFEVIRVAHIEPQILDACKPLDIQEIKIKSYGPCELRINSVAIIHALASVVKYWPGLNFYSPSLVVKEPFAVLYQHRAALQQYTSSVTSNPKPAGGRCHRENHTDGHLNLLFDFLDNRPEAGKIRLERERLNRPRPVATFEMLWMHFPLGTDVFIDASSFSSSGSFSSDTLEGMVVKETYGGGLSVGSADPFTIVFWHLEYDGCRMGRTALKVEIQPFLGEKEVGDLILIPCDFYGRDVAGQISEKSRSLREKLINYGTAFLKFLDRQCVQYSGETYGRPRTMYNGRAVIDVGAFYDDLPNNKPSLTPLEDDEIIAMPKCICDFCSKNGLNKKILSQRSPFSDYDDIYPWATNFNGLTEHQKFVFPRKVYDYALSLRRWLTLDIAYVQECHWNTTMIDRQLSINDEDRDMIKGLAQRYVRTPLKSQGEEQWQADFVMEKGDSQIFLLHGTPGVGKTFTAECVAEALQRPLLALNCTDIGVDSAYVETQLVKFFKKAKLWGAVLLLDEADVYLEQRTLQDLDRNCLVAAFLRALEYYQGVLFLTTNRVGAFDDAIFSRIHIVLHYKFDESKRQAVWDIFFRKLEEERGTEIKAPYSTREYTRYDKELRALEWNGREIRNAFQTAVALAEHKAERDPRDGLIVLRDEHFRQVVRMSANFTKYRKNIHGVEAEKLAASRRDRNEYSK